MSNVHIHAYSNESANQKIVCTNKEIRHINADNEDPTINVISIDEISEIKRDTDESQEGFKLISYIFAGLALVFTFLSVPFLLLGAINTITAGLFFLAVLSWYGVWMFYRMERGVLDVLEIRANNKWYRFFTKKKGTTFDEILSRLPHDVVDGNH